MPRHKDFKRFCANIWLEMSKKEYEVIRNEIRELRMLYKNLIDKMVPLEEPTPSDKSSIKKKEGVASESSLMKALD